MFFVYLIQSEKHGTFYIGQTSSPLDRLKYHNRGKCKYTRNKGPWGLLAFKECASRAEAMAEERRLKNLKNKEAILKEFKINEA